MRILFGEMRVNVPFDSCIILPWMSPRSKNLPIPIPIIMEGAFIGELDPIPTGIVSPSYFKEKVRLAWNVVPTLERTMETPPNGYQFPP
jgi:hypothetical protein